MPSLAQGLGFRASMDLWAPTLILDSDTHPRPLPPMSLRMYCWVLGFLLVQYLQELQANLRDSVGCIVYSTPGRLGATYSTTKLAGLGFRVKRTEGIAGPPGYLSGLYQGSPHTGNIGS